MPSCPNCGTWSEITFVSTSGNGCFRCGCIFDNEGNIVDYEDGRTYDWEQATGHKRKKQNQYRSFQEEYTRKREDAILQAINNGDRLGAMKLYRELYNATLEEAKKFVDDVGKK